MDPSGPADRHPGADHARARRRRHARDRPGDLRRARRRLRVRARVAAGRGRGRSPRRTRSTRSSRAPPSDRLRIWVDCTAAAHPLVLRPVIEALRERGHEVSITARAYGQTEGLLERLGLPYESFGSHGGASTLGKAAAGGRSQRRARRAGRARGASTSAIAHGSVDLAAVGDRAEDPDGADAGLRVRRPAAQARLAGRPPGDRARRDPGRRGSRPPAPARTSSSATRA